MAGLPWIKVWTRVTGHPKVQRLERELGVRDALGIVVRLWAWTADFAPGGDIPEPEGLDAAKFARGDSCRRSPADALAALVSVGLLDRTATGYRVHDWHEMQTIHVEAEEKRRKQAAERQQRYRERHGDASRNASRNGDSVTEKEKEKEKEIPSPRPPASVLPLGAGGERTKLGDLGARLRAECEAGLGYALTPCSQARADRLEAQIAAAGGVEAARAFVAATIRKRDSDLRSVGGLVEILDAFAPEEARQ